MNFLLAIIYLSFISLGLPDALLGVSSYLHFAKGIDAGTAASFAGMFCIGITIGRGINGFLANHISIRLLPWFLLILLALMVHMHETLERKVNSIKEDD